MHWPPFRVQCSGGSKGGRERHTPLPLPSPSPPPGSKFFQFHAVFGKFWQNRMLAPPGGVGPPSSGKSWIRHCNGLYKVLTPHRCVYHSINMICHFLQMVMYKPKQRTDRLYFSTLFPLVARNHFLYFTRLWLTSRLSYHQKCPVEQPRAHNKLQREF